MSVTEYVEKELGFKTRALENPVTNRVGTTPTLVLRNNPDRFQWLIVNLSAYNVYVAFTREVSSTRGVLVAASGGALAMHAREDGEAVTYEVYAISPDGIAAIYVIEYEKR